MDEIICNKINTKIILTKLSRDKCYHLYYLRGKKEHCPSYLESGFCSAGMITMIFINIFPLSILLFKWFMTHSINIDLVPTMCHTQC